MSVRDRRPTPGPSRNGEHSTDESDDDAPPVQASSRKRRRAAVHSSSPDSPPPQSSNKRIRAHGSSQHLPPPMLASASPASISRHRSQVRPRPSLSPTKPASHPQKIINLDSSDEDQQPAVVQTQSERQLSVRRSESPQPIPAPLSATAKGKQREVVVPNGAASSARKKRLTARKTMNSHARSPDSDLDARSSTDQGALDPITRRPYRFMRKSTNASLSAHRPGRPPASSSPRPLQSVDDQENDDCKFDFDTFDAEWATGRDLFDASDPYLQLLSGLLDQQPDARQGTLSPSETRQAFEDMMEASRAREDPFATAITIENEIDPDLNACPALEFAYTDRYRYTEGVGDPVPKAGCRCIGACDPRSGSACSCLALQTRLSGKKAAGFAYDEEGLLRPELSGQGIAIVECSASCGCGDACSNRVAQKGRRVDVQLFKTESRGWGVRATSSIHKDQFIAVYGGDLMTVDEASQLDDYYDIIGRTYLFDLDFGSIASMSHGFLLTEAQKAQKSSAPAKFVVDAYSAGFTRFFNHSCDPNLTVEAVWYDDFDPYRPFIAFFARRDIAAGEELTFSYSGGEATEVELVNELAASSQPDETAEQLVERVRRDPRSSNATALCKCGASQCRGIMFKSAAGPSLVAVAEDPGPASDPPKEDVEPVLPYPDDSGSDYEPADDPDADSLSLAHERAQDEVRQTRNRKQGSRRPQ